MLSYIVAISLMKIVLLPAYHSTDFEVHRNWLAITHNLPLKEWYRDKTSEWTLDYPPLFAWFEWILSKFAFYFDSNMLEVNNLKYASQKTVLFQRLTVILSDLVFAFSLKECIQEVKKSTKDRTNRNCKALFLIIFGNAGLVLVDHIHFQYNGFLFGVMFLSIARILQRREIEGAFWFCVLLNLKHIYLYIAPAYFVYLLRSFCFSSKSNGSILWLSLSFRRLFALAIVVLSVFAISFGPFIVMGQLYQVVGRLFPFKRGLSHAYWAPNFWALYNFVDKVFNAIAVRLKLSSGSGAGIMTGGLVQEYSHSILPTISPLVTFILTFLSMIPCLVSLWRTPHNSWHFVRSLTMCGFCSFMFGWHVHEKAILLVVLPLSLLCLLSRRDANIFFLLNIVANFSLFPLIFTHHETVIKVTSLLLHASFASFILRRYWKGEDTLRRFPWGSFLNGHLETLYVYGLLPLFIYKQFIHSLLGLHLTLPFLPLLTYSVYCSVGVLYCWLGFYCNIFKVNRIMKREEKFSRREEIQRVESESKSFVKLKRPRRN